MSWIIWLFILITASWFFFYLLWNAKFRSLSQEKVPILVYHRVADGFDWSITRQKTDQFKRGIRFLHDQGFRSARLDDEFNQKEGREEKKIFITFDDGYEDFYFKAFPILKEFGFTACIFVVTGYVGKYGDWDYGWGRHKQRHLSWQQIEEMARAGFELGSHTVNHPDLTKIPRRFVRYELMKSKETLEQKLSRKVDFLSYPFGRHDRYVEQEAEKAGYKSAYTMSSSPNRESGRFTHAREGIYLLDSPLTLRIKLYPNKLAWVEEMKGRIINRFPDWTVALKGSPNYDQLPEGSASWKLK